MDYHTGLWYEGEQTVKISAPIEYNPLLVMGGAIIAVNDASVDFATKDTDKRGFLLYPPLKGSGNREYEFLKTMEFQKTIRMVNLLL